MHRRQFLKTSAASSILAMATPVWSIKGPLPRLIFDSRFRLARQFGDNASAKGAEATGFAGDATSLWYGELDRIAGTGRPLAGMTTGGVLFCLERLAAQHRMELAFHAVHPEASIERSHISYGDARILRDGVSSRPDHVEAWVELAMRHLIDPAPHRQVGKRTHLHLKTDAAPGLESWVLVQRPSVSA